MNQVIGIIKARKLEAKKQSEQPALEGNAISDSTYGNLCMLFKDIATELNAYPLDGFYLRNSGLDEFALFAAILHQLLV